MRIFDAQGAICFSLAMSHSRHKMFSSDTACKEIVAIVANARQRNISHSRTALAVRPESDVRELGSLKLLYRVGVSQPQGIRSDAAGGDVIVRHRVHAQDLGGFRFYDHCPVLGVEAQDGGGHAIDKITGFVHVASQAHAEAFVQCDL